VKPISSSANPAFKAWLRLALNPREARTQRRCLAEGLHLAEAAMQAGAGVEAVLLRRGRRSAAVERLVAAALAGGANGYELADTLYDRIAPVEHGVGLMLVVAVPEQRLPQRARGDLVYLDGVQDPGNVGTLLRTAAAAGVGEVIAAPTTASLWSPKSLRAGQGAQFRLRLHEQIAPEALPETLNGLWIGTDTRAGAPLWAAELPVGPVGWMFGGEGAGLSGAARAVCRQFVSIPICSGVESLNVAAAAAVCLFERRRRFSSAH
jgi:TrmH family RNA methyltransferase